MPLKHNNTATTAPPQRDVVWTVAVRRKDSTQNKLKEIGYGVQGRQTRRANFIKVRFNVKAKSVWDLNFA